MAYVLGFFAADGSMYLNPRGSHYLSFLSNDYEILEKIRFFLSSNHKIGERRISKSSSNLRYTLQIGSKRMYLSLLKLGLTSNKSKTLKFPHIPIPYLRDFVRGYFDGDGNVLFKNYFRKDRNRYKYYFATKFICGSDKFLQDLRIKLTRHAGMGKGSLYQGDRSHVLSYALNDTKKLFWFMYNNVSNSLYLERKYGIFSHAINILER
ncbi:hypothetical protein KKG71_00680 [Patescibacteria group bacterium]|nr:hypothetical protein [Patescibacteria group bacterium]